jgi:hypothetical protein
LLAEGATLDELLLDGAALVALATGLLLVATVLDAVAEEEVVPDWLELDDADEAVAGAAAVLADGAACGDAELPELLLAAAVLDAVVVEDAAELELAAAVAGGEEELADWLESDDADEPVAGVAAVLAELLLAAEL